MVPHRPRARHRGPQWLSVERVGRTVHDPCVLGALAIITEACIDVKDRACVDGRPVQCIYEFDHKNNALFSEDAEPLYRTVFSLFAKTMRARRGQLEDRGAELGV
jgi:hypothetical protein